MPAVGPRVVLAGEVGAALRAGVVVEPKLDERAWIGIVEPGFAEVVEGGDGGFLRVGNDAVDGFLAVDIGLVLEVAAEGVGGRLEQKAGNGDGE